MSVVLEYLNYDCNELCVCSRCSAIVVFIRVLIQVYDPGLTSTRTGSLSLCIEEKPIQVDHSWTVLVFVLPVTSCRIVQVHSTAYRLWDFQWSVESLQLFLLPPFQTQLPLRSQIVWARVDPCCAILWSMTVSLCTREVVDLNQRSAGTRDASCFRRYRSYRHHPITAHATLDIKSYRSTLAAASAANRLSISTNLMRRDGDFQSGEGHGAYGEFLSCRRVIWAHRRPLQRSSDWTLF